MPIRKKIKMGIAALSTVAMLCPISAYASGNESPNQPTSPGIAANPFGANQTGVYPNLFKKAGYSKKEIDAKVNAAWHQLFHGELGTAPNYYDGQTIYYQLTPDMAYVEDIPNQDVRTEGIGYAMMIAVQLDHQKEFDSLWNYAKTYMQIKSGSTKDFFAWHTHPDGTPMDKGVAPDGDMWIASALSFASGRWGDGHGIYEYKKEAQQILHAMWHNSDNGGVDLFDQTTYLPVFSPPYAVSYTDPSYSLPAFYKVFAAVNPSDKDLWEKAYTAGEQLLQNAANPEIGLAPDYSNFDGTPYMTPADSPTDSHYNHTFQADAWRAIANANVDAAWLGIKPWQTQYSNTLENFFVQQGFNTYTSHFLVDGTVLPPNPTSLEPPHAPGLVAMNGVSAISATRSDKMDFVNELWNLEIPSGYQRYYDGMLYTLGLLYDSGKFRIWYDLDNNHQYPGLSQKK